MIKFVDESGSINYCLCIVLVSGTITYSFMVKRYVYIFLVKTSYVGHKADQLLI